MRRLLFIVFFLFISITLLIANAMPGESKDKPIFAPDKIKIQLTVDAYSQTNIPEEMYAEAESFNLLELDALLSELQVTKIIRAHRKVKDTAWEKETGFDRWFILSVPIGTDILKTADLLKTNALIENAVAEGYFYLDYVPNDPFYANNWGHNNTTQLPAWTGGYEGSHSGPLVGTPGFDSEAQNAWDDTQGLGSASIIIAIVDSGVDLTHPDLRLVAGYDFGDNDSNPSPDVSDEDAGHGTSCAGIAAAIGNNGLGVAGIAAGCSVMPLKVSDSLGRLEYTYSINALTYAGDQNVDVISMSFGGNAIEQSLYDLFELAIDYAYDQGALLFASTGNDNTYTIKYPAWSDKVIGVGAASPTGERKSFSSSDGEYWWGSNYGSEIADNGGAVDLMAPTILPTTDIMGVYGYASSNYYQWFNGTSCACPYAAGVAALLLSKYPFMSQTGVRSRLMMSATDMTINGGIGWDRYTGYGLVNAGAILDFYDNIWTGEYSSDWSDSRNWSESVPNSNINVRIGQVEAGCFYPIINTATASCKNLTLYSGASLTVVSYNLVVSENMLIYGTYQQTGFGDVVVNGYLLWGSGSTGDIANSSSELFVTGNLYFKPGSNIQLSSGSVVLSGAENSGIYVNAVARINNLRSEKELGYVTGFHSSSTSSFYIDGYFTNLSERVFWNYHPGTVHVNGNFTNQDWGVFLCYDGTMSFEGSSGQLIQNSKDQNNFFNHVVIVKSSGVTAALSTDIEVRGNLTINGGIFQSNNNEIYLKGNWVNNVGEAAFIEGDGALVLTGTANQFLYNEHFGTLDMNKASGEMRIPAGSTVTCDKYNLTTGVYRVTGGTFTVANRLIQPGIHGTIYLDSGTINYHQVPEDRNDFNGTLYINGGSFNMYGGSDDCYWAYAANAALHMTGGIFDFKEKSIIITNLTTVLTLDIIDGTIRTARAYQCNIDYVNLPGGTLELYGTEDALLHMSPQSSVFNLNINKSSSRSLQSVSSQSRGRNERDNAVAADGDLFITGNLTISQGRLDVRQFNLQVNGNIVVYGVLKKNSPGFINTYGDFIWQDGSESDITAGTILCKRHWRFYSGSTVDLSLITTTLDASQSVEITASSPDAWFGALNLGVEVVDIATFTLVEESTDALIVKGPLTITGAYTLLSEGIPIKTENSVTVNDNCKLSLGPDSILRLKIGTSLTIISGGTLEVLGSAGHPATITHLTSGYYYCNIESGATISAEYGIFEYMQSQGVNVKIGALVDATHSFNYCTFRNGYGNGVLLTVDNNQVFSAYGVSFPTSATTSSYNVKKIVNLGTATFINATGAFSGEDYDNDTYNRINWTNTSCDLSINDYWAISDQLYVCEENSYGIEIYNSSPYPSIVPIRVDLYYNRETMPAAGEIGDEYIYLDPLDAGEAISYELLAVPSEVACTWKTWFRIDSLNEIAETNENNNADGYLETIWLALPIVQNLTISFNESTQRTELTWTYPAEPELNRFKVYRSENPYGPFDMLVSSPTATFFSPLITGDKYFYQVRAEKTWP